MTIRYVCRSCRQVLAEFPETTYQVQLGLGTLTPEERMEMIQEDEEGNMQIQIICEYCQDALLHHPELSLLTSPLQ